MTDSNSLRVRLVGYRSILLLPYICRHRQWIFFSTRLNIFSYSNCTRLAARRGTFREWIMIPDKAENIRPLLTKQTARNFIERKKKIFAGFVLFLNAISVSVTPVIWKQPVQVMKKKEKSLERRIRNISLQFISERSSTEYVISKLWCICAIVELRYRWRTLLTSMEKVRVIAARTWMHKISVKAWNMKGPSLSQLFYTFVTCTQYWAFVHQLASIHWSYSLVVIVRPLEL